MDATLTPPPYALLIRGHREAPPYMSIRRAAAAATKLARSVNAADPDNPVPVPEVSASTWGQIEKGSRMDKDKDGQSFARQRGAPAPTLAVMAVVTRASPEQLTEAGRPDAAGELEALLHRIESAREGKPGTDAGAVGRLAADASELAELARALRARQARPGEPDGRSAAS